MERSIDETFQKKKREEKQANKKNMAVLAWGARFDLDYTPKLI